MTFKAQLVLTSLISLFALFAVTLISLFLSKNAEIESVADDSGMSYLSDVFAAIFFVTLFFGVFFRVVCRFAWFAGLRGLADGTSFYARMYRSTYVTGPTAFIFRWIMHIDRTGEDRDATN